MPAASEYAGSTISLDFKRSTPRSNFSPAFKFSATFPYIVVANSSFIFPKLEPINKITLGLLEVKRSSNT